MLTVGQTGLHCISATPFGDMKHKKMDLNTVFLKYGHNGLWQTPYLKMARIVMLLKVTNNIFDIAIHQAIQQRQ